MRPTTPEEAMNMIRTYKDSTDRNPEGPLNSDELEALTSMICSATIASAAKKKSK